jgi:diguanylate cyclase (GGDEF)-like protein/PAS domain S-box-containing protein
MVHPQHALMRDGDSGSEPGADFSSPAAQQSILIVEDDLGQVETLAALLEDEGFAPHSCGTAAAALKTLAENDYAVAIVDLRLPDQVGTGFVLRLREIDPRVRIIVHTGFSTLDSAIESVNLGVFAYLRKGDAPQALLQTVQRAAYAYLGEALRDSQEKSRRFADNAGQLIGYIDTRLRFRFLNQRYGDWYAAPVETMVNRSVRDVIGDSVYHSVDSFLKLALSGSKVSFPNTIAYPDGVTRDITASYFPDEDSDGIIRGIFVMVTDETERRHAEVALRDSEATFRAVFEQSVFGICVIDGDGFLSSTNRAFQALVGYSGEELETLAPSALMHADDLVEANRYAVEMFKGAREHWQMEARLTRKDGSITWSNIAISAVRDGQGQISFRVGMLEDITEAKHLSEQLAYQASHDPLTGLVNRREFELRLKRVVDHVTSDTEHALCYVDLDQFKLINDTCGHIAGDALLRQLGSLLPNTVRKRDTLARLGGDEFGLLMEHCPPDQALRVADSIRMTIANFRFFWEGKSFNIGASIGLVPITTDNATVSEVMKAADTACYAAKEQGRNRVHVFRPDDDTLRQRSTEMRWATRLNEALENDEFELYFQPLEPVSETLNHDGAFVEVLLRLREADGTLVSPGAFLPAAERYGVASRIDRWVLARGLEWLASESGQNRNIDIFAVNLSAQSVGDISFVDFVDTLLESHGIQPERLCFEIAESAAVANLAHTQVFVRELSGRGVRMALDNFGNGLSSFAYLKSLPVDYLKIDGALIRGMVGDPVVQTMVKSVNEIGQVMGKKTVAEFAESDELVAQLKELGVDYVQGYAITRPQPLC